MSGGGLKCRSYKRIVTSSSSDGRRNVSRSALAMASSRYAALRSTTRTDNRSVSRRVKSGRTRKILLFINMKKIHFFLLIVFFGSLRAQKASQPYDFNTKYSPEDLRFDLAILKDALVKTHPGLFWYQSEKEFENNYIKVKNSITGPMTEMEFYNLITPFVSNARCGHTDLMISEAFLKYSLSSPKFFPLNIKIINSKIYVVKNFSNDTSIAIGTELISINGIRADSLVRLMQPYQWTDGFTVSYTRMTTNFQFLLLSLLNYPDRYVLNTIEPKGNSRVIESKGITYKKYVLRLLKEQLFNPNKKRKHFSFRIIDSLNTAILRIDEFTGRGYYRFLERTFKTLKRKGIKNLIIDIRGNDGGDGYYASKLNTYIAINEYKYFNHLEMTIDDPKDSIFNYGKTGFSSKGLQKFHASKLRPNGNGTYDLKNSEHKYLSDTPFKPDKNNFTGNVFILIDVKSYSASSEFAAFVHYNKRAKFIGRETAGAYCGDTAGWDFLLKLPKTKIQATIPLIKFYRAVEGPYGRGIMPDYLLDEDIKDHILNKDSDLLFTLDLIKRSK